MTPRTPRLVQVDGRDLAAIAHVDDAQLYNQDAIAYLADLHVLELTESVVGRSSDASPLLAGRHPGALAGWVMRLPYVTNPIPANKPSGRGHWAHAARAVAAVRQTAFALARPIGPQPRIRVRLDWEVTTRRTRDEDNLVPCMKALVDGIRSAGVVPDDDRTYVLRDMPQINYAPRSASRTAAHMRLWIWRV